MNLLQLMATVADKSPGVSDLLGAWEIAKGVLLTLSTLGVGAIWHSLGRARAVALIVDGVDGKNGLRSRVDDLETEVEAIKERNRDIDAIAKWEREQHPGEDRRQGARRLRDVMHEAEDIHRSGDR